MSDGDRVCLSCFGAGAPFCRPKGQFDAALVAHAYLTYCQLCADRRHDADAYFWAHECLTDLMKTEPEAAFSCLCLQLDAAESPRQAAEVARSLLADLFQQHGAAMRPQISALAEASPRFRHALRWVRRHRDMPAQMVTFLDRLAPFEFLPAPGDVIPPSDLTLMAVGAGPAAGPPSDR